MLVCRHCKRRLLRRPETHVHLAGEGFLWQRCDKCKWEGSKPLPYLSCPSCGRPGLRNDHYAETVRG